MARFREVPCLFYVCHGDCKKGRDADHNGYCQKCDKYKARAKVHSVNKKRAYNEKQKGKIFN